MHRLPVLLLACLCRAALAGVTKPAANYLAPHQPAQGQAPVQGHPQAHRQQQPCALPTVLRFVTTSSYHVPVKTITKTLAVTDTIYLRSTVQQTSTILQTATLSQSAAKPVTQYVTELHTKEILLPGSTSVIYDTKSITSYEEIINYRYFTSTTTDFGHLQ